RIAEGRVCSRLMLSSETLLCLEARYEVRSFDLQEPLRPVAQEPGRERRPERLTASPDRTGPRPAVVAQAAQVAQMAQIAKVVEVSHGRAILGLGAAAGFVEG